MLGQSALAKAQAIRHGIISARELADLYLARIERLNPKIMAFVTILADAARAEAARRDRELRTKGDCSNLFGVPTAVKDLGLCAVPPRNWDRARSSGCTRLSTA
jgi:amidase